MKFEIERKFPFEIGDLIRWTGPNGTDTDVGLVLNVTKSKDGAGFCWSYYVLNLKTNLKSHWREDCCVLKSSFTLVAEGEKSLASLLRDATTDE
jgi:hypothetical protein